MRRCNRRSSSTSEYMLRCLFEQFVLVCHTAWVLAGGHPLCLETERDCWSDEASFLATLKRVSVFQQSSASHCVSIWNGWDVRVRQILTVSMRSAMFDSLLLLSLMPGSSLVCNLAAPVCSQIQLVSAHSLRFDGARHPAPQHSSSSIHTIFTCELQPWPSGWLGSGLQPT